MKTDAEGGHRSSQSLRAQRQNHKTMKAGEGGKDFRGNRGDMGEKSREGQALGKCQIENRGRGEASKDGMEELDRWEHGQGLKGAGKAWGQQWRHLLLQKDL